MIQIFSNAEKEIYLPIETTSPARDEYDILMKNIIYLSGSDLFPRMKIGVGSKPEGWDLADWVLPRFTNDEMKTLKTVSENVTSAVELLLSGAPDKAMNRYNS